MVLMLSVQEERRLAVLKSYDLFGTPPEPDYDRLAALATELFKAPICLVSLIGETDQWLKAHHGLDLCSTERDISFCTTTLTRSSPVVVLDASKDVRFSTNPLVTGSTHIRFYAGAPLIDAAGVHLGAFCIIDTEPRESFSEDQCQLLTQLAATAMAQMEERRVTRVGQALAGFAGATAIAIVTADARGTITFWNKAAEAMFGYLTREAVGRSLDLIVPARFHAGHHAGMDRLATGGPPKLAGKTVEVVAVRRDGSEFPIEITITAWIDGADRAFGAQIQDITERRAREERLQHLAHHDSLTGLMNRTGFRENLERVCGVDGRATLLAVDLDGFKIVNDNFGHPVGDALLQAIAIRLTSCADLGAHIARTGGDEFTVVLAGRADPLAAHEVAEGLLHAFRQPFAVAGHVLQVGLSIGIALMPLHAADLDEMLLRADLALLAAKKDGGRRARFFDAGMGNEVAVRRAFKDELRLAIGLQQWELFYQPQVRLDDCSLLGMEALLRWRHPRRGLLTPAAFMSVLETHSIAYEVGSWIVDEACGQLASWRRAGRYVPRVGVNVFAAQFAAGTLEQTVSNALRRHNLQPADLEIEVTESIALRPGDHTIATLRALRTTGVHIALDDFGTGFASLTTLKQLPVTRLKIDRSFVSDIGEAPHSAAIVAAIVSLADRLDLEVIAEGVETENQREALVGLGCVAGQGYLFGRPMEATALLPQPRQGRHRADCGLRAGSCRV